MAFIRLVMAIIVQFPGFCSLAVGGFRIFRKSDEKYIANELTCNSNYIETRSSLR